MVSASADSGVVKSMIFLIVLLNFKTLVSSKWVKSSFDVSENWKFITRFCFLSERGRFDYVFKYPKSYGIQRLLLYYDAPGQWDAVYKSNKNCTQRLSVLSQSNNQIIDLTNQETDSRDAGCSVFQHSSGEDYYNCTDFVAFRAARERWWYIALARCEPSQGSKTGLKLEYEIHMMNGQSNDFLHHELSADEFYILPVDIAFLLLYVALLTISIACAVVLQHRYMFHTTYKMYMLAVILWLFGLFLQCIAWGIYGATGWEESRTEVAGRLFLAASTAVFILMLLLLSKGFTVTRGRLTHMSTMRLTIFFCLYVIINITLFIWEGMVFDEGLVLYFYESPPGYGLIAVRLIAWLWFLYGFVFTMKHHSNKALFYIPFFTFYTLWFWTGPVVILIAIRAMDKWSRQKAVNGIEQGVAFVGHLFFLFLTRPSATNANFPFHLRVSQVRFSDNEEEPDQRYTISEESRQHLESIFVVQRSGQTTAIPSAPHLSYATANICHVNGGFNHESVTQNGYTRNENSFNPTLDETFTTQRDSQHPVSSDIPQRNSQHPVSSDIPQRNIQHPVSSDIPHSSVPPLKPFSDPLLNEDVQLKRHGNNAQLPPLINGGSHLPLTNGRALPPISVASTPPAEK